MKKIILLLILFTTENIFGQGIGLTNFTDSQLMSMTGSFLFSSGLMAVGKNPANIFKYSGSTIELISPLPVPNLSIGIVSNFFTLKDYNFYLGTKIIDSNGEVYGKNLTRSDKDKLKSIFKSNNNVNTDISIQLFGIKIQPSNKSGALSFAMSDRISFSLTFPKSLVELLFDGNQPDKIYNFSDAKFNAWWLRKFSLTYSNEFNIVKNFKLGVSLNFVNGYFLTAIEKNNTTIKTDSLNIITGFGEFLAYSAFSSFFNMKYSFDNVFPKPLGNGIGVDLGIITNISENLAFAFSMTDIGTITWKNNIIEYSSNAPIYLDDISNKKQVDTLISILTGRANKKYINSLKTNMNTAIHLGIMWTNKPVDITTSKFDAVFEYHQVLNYQPGITNYSIVFSLDYFWIKTLYFRTGLSFGEFYKFNWAFGIGFNFKILEINFATNNFQNVLFPDKTKGLTFACYSIWKI
ncbi:DUF5723 family protein [Rosettibacter firmus]|uniref:DUF5723 family protein n=1 Tax=Rosettibacter firmus TaxID=3111522 RepID=UPI00336C0B74